MEEIALARGLKPTTIYGHCAEAISLGLLEPHGALPLPAEKLDAIRAAFEANRVNGQLRMKPVFELFAEQYSYDQLRCVAAGMDRQQADA